LFDKFMLQYQIPIMKPFGLAAYGCCEDLSLKIGALRRIPNLRRIAVAPMANVAKCAELIGTDYVISYRPSPSDMVGYDFDPDRIRRILRRDLHACRGQHVDITLKDVETVQGDPNRVRQWVKIARQTIDECCGGQNGPKDRESWGAYEQGRHPLGNPARRGVKRHDRRFLPSDAFPGVPSLFADQGLVRDDAASREHSPSAPQQDTRAPS
jgi:hypothetical protein